MSALLCLNKTVQSVPGIHLRGRRNWAKTSQERDRAVQEMESEQMTWEHKGKETPAQPVPNPTGICVLEQQSWSRISLGRGHFHPWPEFGAEENGDPKSKESPVEGRCERIFLRHPLPSPQEPFPWAVGAERGSQGIPGVPNPQFPHPAQLRALISPKNPFHLSPGTASKESDTVLFVCTNCRGEQSSFDSRVFRL